LNVDGVKQTEIHTAEPPVPELSGSEVELAIEKLKSQSPGIDQIPAHMIKAGVRQYAVRFINLFRFGMRRNCLRGGRGRS